MADEGASSECDLGGLRVADHPRKKPRAAALRQHPSLGERRRELRRLTRNADVAPEREIHAVASGSSVQRAHRGRVHVVQDDRWGVTQIELARTAAHVAQPAAADCSAMSSPARTCGQRPSRR